MLPVWNGAATIGAAVDSMLGQTLADIEVIVIDDGSTDDTPAVLAGIHDERLRVSRNPERRGLAASLNAGVEMATSGLIARMDADDVAYPGSARARVRAVPCVSAGRAGRDRVRRRRRSRPGLRYVGVPPDHASVALWLLFGCCLAHPTVMFRRDVFRLVGGYRETEFPADDYGLWLRMVDVTQVATVPSPQLAYRPSSTGVSAVDADGMRDGAIELAAGAIERATRKRPSPRIVAGLTGLGPPLGCDDCDEALGRRARRLQGGAASVPCSPRRHAPICIANFRVCCLAVRSARARTAAGAVPASRGWPSVTRWSQPAWPLGDFVAPRSSSEPAPSLHSATGRAVDVGQLDTEPARDRGREVDDRDRRRHLAGSVVGRRSRTRPPDRWSPLRIAVCRPGSCRCARSARRGSARPGSTRRADREGPDERTVVDLVVRMISANSGSPVSAFSISSSSARSFSMVASNSAPGATRPRARGP